MKGGFFYILIALLFFPVSAHAVFNPEMDSQINLPKLISEKEESASKLRVLGDSVVRTSVTVLIPEEGRCPLETKKAYRHPDSPRVFYITEECTRRAFVNPDIFFSYFDDWSDVVTNKDINLIKNDKLGFMPWGPKYDPKFGALVKTIGDPKIYLLLENEKRWISSETVFRVLGYKWNWVEDVDPDLLAGYTPGSEIKTTSHPNYSLVKSLSGPEVYRLEPDSENPQKQVRRHVVSEDSFRQLGYRFDRVVEISKRSLEMVPVGEPISR